MTNHTATAVVRRLKESWGPINVRAGNTLTIDHLTGSDAVSVEVLARLGATDMAREQLAQLQRILENMVLPGSNQTAQLNQALHDLMPIAEDQRALAEELEALQDAISGGFGENGIAEDEINDRTRAQAALMGERQHQLEEALQQWRTALPAEFQGFPPSAEAAHPKKVPASVSSQYAKFNSASTQSPSEKPLSPPYINQVTGVSVKPSTAALCVSLKAKVF